MNDNKGSGIGFLVLLAALGFVGWRLAMPTEAATQTVEGPNACATYLLTQAGYGPSTFVTAVPLPNHLQEQITSQCILPYLSPANSQMPPLVTP